MRYSLFLFACLAISFGSAKETKTVAPTEDFEDGNDQDPMAGILGEEPETVSPEEEVEEESEGELAQEEEEEEETATEEPTEAEDEVDVDKVIETAVPTPDGDDEDESTKEPIAGDVDESTEEPIDEDVEESTKETVDEDTDESTKETVDEDVDKDVVGEDKNDEFGEPDEIPTDEDLFSEIVEEEEKETSTDFPTPVPETRFTPSPSALRKPSPRPETPYISTDDDPLKNDKEEGFDNWGFNEETLEEVEKDLEEMEHDPKVIIALSVVFGVMFFFSIFVAFQMLENPNGCCASICKFVVAFFCFFTRCICYPCRKLCGCTGQSDSGQDHMMLPNDGHFTHDLELS